MHRSKLRLGLVGVACAMVGLGGQAVAGIINVPGDQPTIQAGIDATMNGDEVVVGVDTGTPVSRDYTRTRGNDLRDHVKKVVVEIGDSVFPAKAAFGSIIFFSGPTAQADFEAAAADAGKIFRSFEDFEGGNIAPGILRQLDDPLTGGVPNLNAQGIGFPTGLAAPNFTYQSNTLAGNPVVPSPGGASFLRYFGEGLGGIIVSDLVTNHFAGTSIDLIFGGDDKTAVGFDLISGVGILDIRVYDIDNVLIGTAFGELADPAGTHFLGVLATGSDIIGRININEPNTVFVGGADNIQMWTSFPEPDLDIKPGSCPNSFNRNSNGLLPVALVGDPAFDVGQLDLTTVQLERADGIGGSVQPNEGPPGPHSVFEDVATPFNGELCDCHELTGDGIDDLSMKFKSQQVVAALELNDLPPGALVELCVSGELLDGTEFEACDCVRLVPPGDIDGDGLVGVADLLRLLAEWGPCGPTAECSADYNSDAMVGVVDLLIMLGNWS